jgi:hypothetical protein
VVVNKHETAIIRVNFYSGDEILVKVGRDKDSRIKLEAGRKRSFEIANDEQLIGCELYHGNWNGYGSDIFLGVTWLKCKITK